MNRLSESEGRALVRAARAALHDALGAEPIAVPAEASIERPGASFVTLRRDGELRGCIGTVEARRPLGEDVRRNAVAAAFRDPRFQPLERHELPDTRVEVSVLGDPEPLPVRDEADAVSKLRAGVDGVILSLEGRRSVFLPQVWDTVPDPQAFLQHLKEKMGLARDTWPAGIELARFDVQKWTEAAP